MHDPQDRPAFLIAMKRLSTAFSIELTDDRVATYWDALCDLRIDGVVFASQHASRHWRPTTQERFPVPATLREYAKLYREEQKHREAREAEKQLPQWSSTPDEMGLQAIREIRRMLGEHMEMTHPVYQQPSMDDPEKRKKEIREQVRLNLGQERDKHPFPEGA